MGLLVIGEGGLPCEPFATSCTVKGFLVASSMEQKLTLVWGLVVTLAAAIGLGARCVLHLVSLEHSLVDKAFVARLASVSLLPLIVPC